MTTLLLALAAVALLFVLLVVLGLARSAAHGDHVVWRSRKDDDDQP